MLESIALAILFAKMYLGCIGFVYQKSEGFFFFFEEKEG